MSNTNLRSFVGLPISEPLSSELESLAAELSALDVNRMTWVPSDNYHITLLFLDTQSPQWLEQFALEIDQQLELEPIEITLSHLMPFPESSPKLLAAMIEENAQLTKLHQDLKRIALNLGVQVERRRFKPHITLARKFPKTGQHLMLPTLEKTTMVASEMFIYESRLRQTGAEYYPLYGFGTEFDDAYEA